MPKEAAAWFLDRGQASAPAGRTGAKGHQGDTRVHAPQQDQPGVQAERAQRPSVGRDDGAVLAAADIIPVEMLFVGPFAVQYVCDKVRKDWTWSISGWLQAPTTLGSEARLRSVTCDPPFDIPDAVDGKGYWVRPYHPKPDDRRKLLRKQIFTSMCKCSPAW